MPTPPTSPARSEDVSLAAWRRAVEADLPPGSFEKRLVSRTREGLRVEPLYPDAPDPAAPRPARAAGGWRAVVELDFGAGLGEARADLARELGHGVRGLRLRGARPADLVALLADVDLGEVALFFEGGDALALARTLEELARERGVQTTSVVGGLGASALSAEAVGDLRTTFPGLRLLRASARDEAERGAGEALQVALVLWRAAAEFERWLESGVEVGEGARALELEVALGTDVFIELAKLRALRLAWARLVAGLSGDAEAQRATITAHCARRVWTRRDPWVNLLRATTIGFTAATGGADHVVLAPFDACLGHSDAQARRLAANTHALLERESRLASVEDPAAGSGLVEALTEELAREAWRLFGELRARGATAAAWAEERIAETALEEARAIRTRRRGLVGVSEYPLLDEELPSRPPLEGPDTPRLAAPFETLRDRSDAHLAATDARPLAFLANLGPIAEHTARATFATNLLAAGGIGVVGNDGFEDIGEAARAFTDSGAALCVICSSDARYAELAAPLARELAARGATTVLAGRPGEHEAEWRAAGVAHFIHLGCDALSVLESLLEAAGVPS